MGQSKELASHLVTLDPPIEAVYSSPFYRCLETLSPFVTLQLQKQEQGRTGGRLVSETAMIRLERGIQEWFGSAPFDHPEPATADVLKTLFPTINGEYRSVVSPSKRGETLAELQDRVAVALRAIIDRCDAEGTRAVLLCSHAAVIIVLGRILTGQVPEAADTDDFYAYTCGLSVFRRAAPVEEGRVQGPRPLSADRVETNKTSRSLLGGWQCELNSDCSFLSGGQERGWKFVGDESFPGLDTSLQEDIDSKL
ncbi:hypothetical protein RJ55_01297 [Drechmeria coniospora]|nr:hypothetical protein RJ55_01297 [Drechmeria coniospora]